MWLITFTPNENIDTISLLSYLSQSKSAKKGKIGFCEDETFFNPIACSDFNTKSVFKLFVTCVILVQ